MYKIIVNGKEVWCESFDELAPLLELSSNGASAVNTAPPQPTTPNRNTGASGSRVTTHRVTELLGQLRDDQRQLLREVVSRHDGTTDSALRQALGLRSNQELGPILTAISRRATNVGMSLAEIISSEKRTVGANKMREFCATDAFRAAVTLLGGIK